jgi:hypothetical protein
MAPRPCASTTSGCVTRNDGHAASACCAVRTQILAQGEMIDNLAGASVLRNTQNLRIMPLPTAGDGYVIVGVNNDYLE